MLLASQAWAQAPSYTLYNSESTLTFIATQNNAPVKGGFKKFDAQIRFSPEALADSAIRVEVDMASLTMSDLEILSTLKTAQWFGAELYPTAVFQSREIVQAETANDYIAKGELTLKGKTLPLTLYFHIERMDEVYAVASGYAALLRNDFQVGDGAWADSGSVKNEVRVEFYISAQKQ